MKILVTGANGYIGQSLVKKLLDNEHEVVATDISLENIDKRAEKKQCNLFHLENPYKYFSAPDAVFHLAWRNGFIHNNQSHLEDFPKHYIFLHKLIDSGITQLAVMGSMHEVGFYEGSIKPETPTNPQSLYGISKDALRRSLELLTDNINIVFQWIRGFYIVGNSEYGSSIFSKITAAEKRGEKIFPFTLGQNQWDFIDYDIFCQQLTAIIEQTEYQGIINACSGFPEKLADRVEKFIYDQGYSIKLEYGAFVDRTYDSKAVWGDDRIIQQIMKNKI